MTELVVITCPKCQAKLRTSHSATHSGRIRCPKCQAQFILKTRGPADNTAASEAATAGPSAGAVSSAPAEHGTTRPQQSDVTSAGRPKNPIRPSSFPNALISGPETPRKPEGKQKADTPQTTRKPETPLRDASKASRPAASREASQSKKVSRNTEGNSRSDRKAESSKRRKKRSPSIDPWEQNDGDEDLWGEDPFESADSDLYADSDMPYDDPWTGGALPGRVVKRKTVQRQDERSQPAPKKNFLNSLGVMGWVISGGLAGVLGVLLTTLVGNTGWGGLVAIMSLVVGAMVGGAVRLAAQEHEGWGPGLLAAGIALFSILCGRVGAYYVIVGQMAESHLADTEATREQRVAEATSEPVMISRIADEVQDEWLKSGKLTSQELEQFHDARLNEQDLREAAEEMRSELPESAEESDSDSSDVEMVAVDLEASDASADSEVSSEDQDGTDTDTEPFDPEKEYPSEVWQEASTRWKTKTDDERKSDEEQARTAFLANEKQFNEAADQAQIVLAGIAAIASLILPIKCIVLLPMGVFSAFRIGSRLT